jgi:hypothetical protein
MDRPKIPIAVRVIGLVPIGVALLVLSGVWFGFGDVPLNDMPLFAKLFASLVASMFLFVGLAFLSGGSLVKKQIEERQRQRAQRSAETQAPEPSRDAPTTSSMPKTAKGWNCPQCAAPLGEDTRISPSGDVLCPFCENWFNVRG